MGKILSTNLLTYLGYDGTNNLSKMLGVPKMTQCKIVQTGESNEAPRPGDIVSYQNLKVGEPYVIPDLPSLYEGWRSPSISESTNNYGTVVTARYSYANMPTFVFEGLDDSEQGILYNSVSQYQQSIWQEYTIAFSTPKYIIRGSDGLSYIVLQWMPNGIYDGQGQYGIIFNSDGTVKNAGVISPYNSGQRYNNSYIFQDGQTDNIRYATGLNADTIQELGEIIFNALNG